MIERWYKASPEPGIDRHGLGEALEFRVGDTPALHLDCPCGKRPVIIRNPPHSWSFDGPGGTLVVNGSFGYAADKRHPANWCHFSITKDGVVIHSDSQCPGRGINQS